MRMASANEDGHRAVGSRRRLPAILNLESEGRFSKRDGSTLPSLPSYPPSGRSTITNQIIILDIQYLKYSHFRFQMWRTKGPDLTSVSSSFRPFCFSPRAEACGGRRRRRARHAACWTDDDASRCRAAPRSAPSARERLLPARYVDGSSQRGRPARRPRRRPGGAGKGFCGPRRQRRRCAVPSPAAAAAAGRRPARREQRLTSSTARPSRGTARRVPPPAPPAPQASRRATLRRARRWTSR